MAAHRATGSAMSDEQRRALAELLEEFDRSWDERSLTRWLRRLPPPRSPLRRVLLAEMVKIDLRRQWQAGRHARLEAYLQAFPELGDRDTVGVDLIEAEHAARLLAGAPADESNFARRFPRQAAALGWLVGRADRSAADSVPAVGDRFGRGWLVLAAGATIAAVLVTSLVALVSGRGAAAKAPTPVREARLTRPQVEPKQPALDPRTAAAKVPTPVPQPPGAQAPEESKRPAIDPRAAEAKAPTPVPEARPVPAQVAPKQSAVDPRAAQVREAVDTEALLNWAYQQVAAVDWSRWVPAPGDQRIESRWSSDKPDLMLSMVDQYLGFHAWVWGRTLPGEREQVAQDLRTVWIQASTHMDNAPVRAVLAKIWLGHALAHLPREEQEAVRAAFRRQIPEGFYSELQPRVPAGTNGGVPAQPREARLADEMRDSDFRAKMMQDLLRNMAGNPSTPPGFKPW